MIDLITDVIPSKRNEVRQLIKNSEAYEEALKRIAYPINYPDLGRNGHDPNFDLHQWMQSVAANALTNSGKEN